MNVDYKKFRNRFVLVVTVYYLNRMMLQNRK